MAQLPSDGTIVAVSRCKDHSMTKQNQISIRLLPGLGVEDDAHLGVTVQHLSRMARDPDQPNRRQVHLLPSELFDELQAQGFSITAGQIGENLTTQGIDLLALPTGTRLHLGRAAIVEVTGLRNPCAQLDQIQPGLMNALLDRDPNGDLIRKAGIMSVVVLAGEVKAGDPIRVELPQPPHARLAAV